MLVELNRGFVDEVQAELWESIGALNCRVADEKGFTLFRQSCTVAIANLVLNPGMRHPTHVRAAPSFGRVVCTIVTLTITAPLLRTAAAAAAAAATTSSVQGEAVRI